MESTKYKTFYQKEYHDIHADPETSTTRLGPTAHHIHCDTTGNVLGYKDLIKKIRSSVENLNVQRTKPHFTGM